MLNIQQIAMAYGAKLLFTDVTLYLNKGNRYGLVGGNGAGKSTFLKVLTGEEEQSFGEISITKGARVGFLKQDQFRYENTSIINTVMAGKKELYEALLEKEELLAQPILDNEMGYRIGELEQIVADNDGYNAEIEINKLLLGLGIKEEFHNQNLSVLSGGYKLRVLLAQSLFNNPDVLLLDEPTNHLDIDSIYWLEKYLKDTFYGVLIFISHDITFVNNIATHILDIDYGEIREYTGNYDKFTEQKQLVVEQKALEINNIEKRVAKLENFIVKFRAWASKAKQSKSREKQLDKIELPDLQKSSRISPHFNFKQKRNSGKIALKVNNIAKSFNDKLIISNVNINIVRGEKVIIIGPNGVGKSTFLKVLAGQVIPDGGDFEWGYETHVSYFAQDHHELLNQSMTAFEWLQNQVTTVLPGVIRNVLGQVLFKQDDALKNILSLSGGEGARLLLAKIMLEESNVLILDEPTNHLDIEAKEALKQALIKYHGTLIMVTHDRDFASSIATRIIAFSHKKITDFKGTYLEYLLKYKI